MKRIALLITLLLMITSSAFSEKPNGKDYSAMSLDELNIIRNELINELTLVDNARQTKIDSTYTYGNVLGTIKELFPDENFAIGVKNSCGKTSVNDEVTQDDLDKIYAMATLVPGRINDLTGISLLRNCSYFDFVYEGTTLPDEMQYAYWIEHLEIGNPFAPIPLSIVPEWIGNLTKLTWLDIENSQISELPDTICNLYQLEHLNVANTGISELPSNIGNMTSLKHLDISYTKITALPDSIHNLNLTTINMSGLPLT